MEGKTVRFVVVENRKWVDGMGTERGHTFIVGNEMYRDRKYAVGLVATLSSDCAHVYISDIMERDGIDEDAAWATGEVQCEHADGYARIEFGKSVTTYTVEELHDNQYLL